MLKVILGKLSLLTLAASFAVGFSGTEVMAETMKGCIRKCGDTKDLKRTHKQRNQCINDCQAGVKAAEAKRS